MKKKRRLLDEALTIYRLGSSAGACFFLLATIFGSIFACTLPFLQAMLVAQDNEVWFLEVGLLLTTILFVFLYLYYRKYDRKYRYIAIYPDGIAYRSGIIAAFTTWNNLYYLDVIDDDIGPSRVIMLKSLIPIDVHGGKLGKFWYQIFVSHRFKGNQTHLIDYSFMRDDHRLFSKFEQDLKQFAPHVFEEPL